MAANTASRTSCFCCNDAATVGPHSQPIEQGWVLRTWSCARTGSLVEAVVLIAAIAMSAATQMMKVATKLFWVANGTQFLLMGGSGTWRDHTLR